jgi:pimeloyl-ACP methyl ester carboxylesterase
MAEEGKRKRFCSLSGQILLSYLALLWIGVLSLNVIKHGWIMGEVLWLTITFAVGLIIFSPHNFNIHKGKITQKFLLAIILILFFVLPIVSYKYSHNGVLVSYFIILLLSCIFLPFAIPLFELVVLRGQGNLPLDEWYRFPKALSRLGNALFAVVGSILVIFFGLAGLGSLIDSEDSDDLEPVSDYNLVEYLENHKGQDSSLNAQEFTLIPCPFEWSSCTSTSPEEAGMICGYVTVPLYHDDPKKGSIQIPIGILPAKTDNLLPDPLFMSQGGPGGSTLDVFPKIMRYSEIREIRDVVFIDQRGTRYAKPSLECPEEMEEINESLDDTEESSSSSLDSLQACRERLSGIDLNAFNTKESMDDIESVRELLGYSAINYYGVSYGSFLGQYYAAYYPDKLRSLILDGVVPVPLNVLNLTSNSHERILDELETNCNVDPTCSDQYPFLMDRLTTLIKKLDAEPAELTLIDPASDGEHSIKLTGEEFLSLIFSILYMDYGYATVPFLIKEAEHGRFDYLEAHAETQRFDQETAEGLYNSVICADHEPVEEPVDPGENKNAYLTVHEQETQEAISEECMVWDVSIPNGHLDAMPLSEIPTLLLSGYFDPVTPPEFGEAAAASFLKGQHIVDPIGSHGIAFSDDCTKEIVYGFLKTPNEIIDHGCINDPVRRIDPVPSNSVSGPFLFYLFDSDVSALILIPIPILMIGLMSLRGLGKSLVYAWNWSQRQLHICSSVEKRARRLFELSTWTYCLGLLGLGIGLVAIISRASISEAYSHAMALPAEIRLLLLLPLGLLFALPVSIVTGVYVWRFSHSKKEKAYIILQIAYGIGMVAHLAWLEMLTVWAG